MTSDNELLRRYCEQHSDEAFAELVQRHVDLVYSAALRQCQNTHSAQDIAQTVFTGLARKAPSLCGHANLVGWLFISTRYAAANLARSAARRADYEQRGAMEEQLNASGADDVSWSDVRPELDEALSTLQRGERDAILMRVFKGSSFAEVAAALQISEDAARKRCDRGLQKLRVLLERRGIKSTAAALATTLTAHGVVAAPAGLSTQITGTALAHVAVAGTTTSGLAALVGPAVHFMTTSKLATLAIVSATTLAVGTAVVQRQNQQSLEQTRQQVAADYERERAAVTSLKAQLDAAERERAEAKQTLDAFRATGAVTASAPGGARTASSNTQTSADQNIETAIKRGEEFLRTHPEAQQWLRTRLSAGIRQNYGAIWRELQLTPAEIERVEQLLLDSSSVGMDTPSGELVALALRPFSPLSAADTKLSIEAVIGSEKSARLVEHGRQSQARRITADLAGAVYFTDTPLDPDAAAKLTRLVAQHSPPQNSREPRISPNWEAILGEAKTFLSPSQMKALEMLRSQRQHQSEFSSAFAQHVRAPNTSSQ